MPAKTKYVKLEDCRKCKHHEKNGEGASYITCNRDGNRGTALKAPSNHNPGIRNGDFAVRCHNIEQDNEVNEKIERLKIRK